MYVIKSHDMKVAKLKQDIKLDRLSRFQMLLGLYFAVVAEWLPAIAYAEGGLETLPPH